MSARRAVTRADVRRALEGATEAGLTISRVEIEAGKIVMIFSGAEQADVEFITNPWDGVVEHDADQERAS